MLGAAAASEELYEKMGLEELRWRATDDDIREAVRTPPPRPVAQRNG